MPSIEAYINGFPHPTIARIEGPPTYDAIAEMQRSLSANAASVHTNLGGGQLGYLALTVDPAIYATRAAEPFVAPPNPGILPVIPFGSTVAYTSELVRQHTHSLKAWREHQDVDNALKQQLLGTVNDIIYTPRGIT